jgi:hypothetical protein
VQALHDAGFDAALPATAPGTVATSSAFAESTLAAGHEAEPPTPSAPALQPSIATYSTPFAQRVPDAPAAPTSGAAGATAVAATGADQHPAAAASEGELDDLAHRLYDRFRSRLRLELLIDRERAGLITDLR